MEKNWNVEWCEYECECIAKYIARLVDYRHQNKAPNDAELFGKQQFSANWKVCQESSPLEPLVSIYHRSQLIVSVASVRVCYLATLASVLVFTTTVDAVALPQTGDTVVIYRLEEYVSSANGNLKCNGTFILFQTWLALSSYLFCHWNLWDTSLWYLNYLLLIAA